jgi:hypothetical protein
MPLTRGQCRENRKSVLEALHEETGSFGGDAAAPRVQAYIANATGTTTVEFGYVGGLTLSRFYVDPTNTNQRLLDRRFPPFVGTTHALSLSA